MKISYFLVLLNQFNSWEVGLQLGNERSKNFFRSQFDINVISNMGGKAKTGCATENSVEQNCERSNYNMSTQRGYYIEKLKCAKVKCSFELVTEGQRFMLEVECDNQEELGFDTIYPWDNIKVQYCNKKREFIVWLGGEIEYIS
jgi:hypothetical protein